MEKNKRSEGMFNAVWNQVNNDSDDEIISHNQQKDRNRSIGDISFHSSNSSNSRLSNIPGNSLQDDHKRDHTNAQEIKQRKFSNRHKPFKNQEHNKNPMKLTDDNMQTSKTSSIKREVRFMSFNVLRNLMNKEANEVLLTILNEESGFFLHLEKHDISRDVMAYVLLALGKAITSYMQSNVNSLINDVTSSKYCFFKKVIIFLASFQKFHFHEPYHFHSLLSLSEFLHKFQIALPSTASDPLIEILPLFEKTSKLFLIQNIELYDKVLKTLQEIENRNQDFLQGYTQKEMKQASHKEKLQLQTPPEDYRSIPVLPTLDDIHSSCSFLRPNLVKGQYQDTEHYLDVQFRLLREDYVKPLRDGIAEYLILKKQGKSLKHCKSVKVYSDVHIVKQEFVFGGLVHIAHFNGNNFSKIKWEYSKRFLTGSLLCLSSDDFKTMLFATVARREPKDLRNGFLLLRFEELSDEVLTLSPLRSFVVVETSAYFEAYRHNLHALHRLEESKLPMKPYIVEVQKGVGIPQYLHKSVTYDMRPLLIPLEDKYVIHHVDTSGEVTTNYNFPSEIEHKAKAVPIFEDDHWPTYSELKLDPSQYAAIKAAVTKEFAIIQGPPGTGKTFIGLRIAQLLLHNMGKWNSKSKSPILVVCYTNHALDQFLEGLLLFTRRIVRVGGRGTNEAISKYQLNNLKKAIEEKREVPNHIFKSIRQKRYELHKLTKDIAIIQKSIEKCYSSVLSENLLKDSMSEEHFKLLKYMWSLQDDGFIIHDWLGIRVRDEYQNSGAIQVNLEKGESEMRIENSVAPNDSLSKDDDEEDDESDAEGDIEFIEAQRDINSEEFANVSCNIMINKNEDLIPEVNNDGWMTQGGKKRRKQYITSYLIHTKAMTELEVKNIENIWLLPLIQRWQLYKFWLECFIDKLQKKVFNMQMQLRKEFEKLNEVQTEVDLHICSQACVVGMTTTGAAKYRNILQHLNPKIVVVEEAAEILESHIVTSLTQHTQHVILIGDHQQLKPSPAVYALANKYDLNVSLFERMVKNGMECYRLGIQHRMRPDIAALLVPHIYENLKNHESVMKYENIKGISKNVFFVSHHYNELQEFDSKSKVNQYEANFLIRLCRYILLQGYEPSQITVLTTYSGQLFALKKLVGDGLLKSVRFTVVDNYQGEENDIILISFVRSNEEGEIGFLKVSNRVCVALSRAKKALYCIGNFELLKTKSPLWRNIVSLLQNNQAIGNSLQLSCQNHPKVSNIVASDKDFDSVPEGGCSYSCEFRLSCGHQCSLMCHPYDKEHETIKCHKPCSKTCSYGHSCKKLCSEACGHCTELVDKTLRSCGHTIKVQCHVKDLSKIPCTEPCKKILVCGHTCSRTCSTSCTIKCLTEVDIISPICKHEVKVPCFNSNDLEYLAKVCNKPCGKELSCEHICKGTCSKCYQSRLHIACNQPCKRVLVCGHECKSSCARSCPPCKRPCENQCIHSKCPKKCGEPCDKCAEPCGWSCPHKKCTQLCGEICNRKACDEPCPKKLKCKHPCIGLCGESCPKECRICNEKEVKEVFFGMEDEDDARFVSLEDCGHIIEVTCLTQWMSLSTEGKREIQMKACPKCKMVIRRNLSFGNIVKSCLADIEKVKKITYGDVKENLKLQQQLLLKIESKNASIQLICKQLKKILMSPKSRSMIELTVMDNIIALVEMLENVTAFLETISDSRTFIDSNVQILFCKLMQYVKTSKKLMITFMQDEFLTASEHQLQDLSWEIHRLKLADKLLRFMYNRTAIKCCSQLTAVMNCIISYAPFRASDVSKFSQEFSIYTQLYGEAIINVSDLEKQSILKAMGLSKGHWYQCPNGHVYCITECGGAMVESQCNECGARIGGTSHRLLSDNRVATAMDGATRSAW
ncbi:NFX1-type zinc finger-containing protein 1 [Trichonephila inaurata madagascariensis]|uniref:NFX1-type zinc finger-containing protein 1 n=1 Tax=Trichonephila inaurata madagascariensis TaxID=2747483 RepID=A0A8X6K708_9ARAC|nr:NFX1-type zinc finger-containing protein 1 [Trichonephila inaurata madagascariensis]